MDNDRLAALWSYRPILYLFFVVGGASLLAEIANVFIASYLTSVITVPEGFHRPVNPRATGIAQRADYRSIITKNIFDPTMGIVVPRLPAPAPAVPQPVLAMPPPPPPPPVVIPKTPLNVRLIGTVVRADDPSYAVIQDNRTGRQLIYRVGDFILEDAKIVRIERNRVVVSRGDEDVVLGLGGSSDIQSQTRPAPQPVVLPPPPPTPLRPGGIRNIAENRWFVDRHEIDYAVSHLPEIMTKARVVPNFTDGKPDGFRIFAIQEDSLYAKIGLQNGDVLQRVNNIDVRDPQNFIQVFERLKHEHNIKIDLVRNTQQKTFDYIIR